MAFIIRLQAPMGGCEVLVFIYPMGVLPLSPFKIIYQKYKTISEFIFVLH